MKNNSYYQLNKKSKKFNNKKIQRTISHFFIIFALFVVRAILIIKNLLHISFIFLFKPIKIFGKFVFYSIIVKIYSWYLSFLRKMGWQQKFKSNLFSFIINQKLIHIFMLIISVFLIFINLTLKTQAEEKFYGHNKIILAELIKSDFSVSEDDEQLIIETFDREATISDIQKSYLDNLDAFRPSSGMLLDKEEEIEAPTIAQDGTAIIKPDIAQTRVSKQPRESIIEYIVKAGDSISTIAQEFEISASTILWENNLSAYSIIRPGDKLSILPFSGLQHSVVSGENIDSISKKYSIDADKILAANDLTSDSKLKIGQKLLVPGGKKPYIAPRVTSTYTGISAIKDLIKSPDAKPAPGNKMNWPTEGTRITQYYSWKHYGLDIANKTGTPIYAADAGVIEKAGWGTGYGNQILIDHGGGKKTRYAHLSKFYVKEGQEVGKGETIAAMGSTGWSTGPHLHFEVIINNQKYNPLNYIK
ncbi:hypothetical protein A2331_00230 [Candidatus Falkowbacteria bacterium RIFOXYB2_FULL_34_18]|uniref:LysM domain-containing protein n=1 Tax=Candidatus Falkowbacteria bacterium RIFOXYD2_FULL_34_120 TaxID=1798007 RepID=A0A1F5TP20_9BACT|nr:MAG: hypothetical protein A2331_00230 [Candidatus Falkowbacteria bacterium RIFOXYB2_FULL_34_18]OGF29025.1 MAG: hypothetical protein A2500_02735 [Candidatus Falkowbacteria bacterium RIFOXYC12_FULL_34_55]OGF35958.1 MAG: hypothetical protein A2466_01590 [Candidatus Falkowbacteria bacterium RIFOXYC2_FULL_34_220]OGF38504.1 MAG: hypothetical protein A2515_07115 [Candidatus Falkowbacteria bacterium RIFOXYD12_FULL_34_57]OGF40666.1 MAG: hypothetical protein A2531_03335 [Candidatus Falkowbacteria bact